MTRRVVVAIWVIGIAATILNLAAAYSSYQRHLGQVAQAQKMWRADIQSNQAVIDEKQGRLATEYRDAVSNHDRAIQKGAAADALRKKVDSEIGSLEGLADADAYNQAEQDATSLMQSAANLMTQLNQDTAAVKVARENINRLQDEGPPQPGWDSIQFLIAQVIIAAATAVGLLLIPTLLGRSRARL